LTWKKNKNKTKVFLLVIRHWPSLRSSKKTSIFFYLFLLQTLVTKYAR
jgi:hypothetical protein